MFASISISEWPDEYKGLYRLRYELLQLDPTYALIVERSVLGGGDFHRFKLLRYEQTLSTYQYGVSDPRFPVREAPQLVGEYDDLTEIEGIVKLLIGIAKDKLRETQQ